MGSKVKQTEISGLELQIENFVCPLYKDKGFGGNL
jgi:hypothetical protein